MSGGGSFAYVHTKTPEGQSVRWPPGQKLKLYFNPTNRSNYPINTLQQIVAASIQQWSQKANIQIELEISDSGPLMKQNDIYFTSNSSYLGNGVLGITRVIFSDGNQEIQEADILLNDNLYFGMSPGSNYFLGDVVTHELGHFIGLAHAPVKDASMFYLWVPGNAQLWPDDLAGLWSLYPDSNPKGSIAGTVIGGKGQTPIYGAHVQAFSVDQEKVVAAAISDLQGNFRIEGLGLGENFYLYVAPISGISALPKYYQGAKNNYCTLGKDYVGSFYHTCDTHLRGAPVALSLSLGQRDINIGSVTIRCNLQVSSEYFDTKTNTGMEFLTYNQETKLLANNLVGFFTKYEFDSLAPDIFTLDFTQYADSTTNRYLEVKILSMPLFSSLFASLSLERFDGMSSNTGPMPAGGKDGEYDNNLVARLPLSSTMANNSFTITLTPDTSVGTLASYHISYLDFVDARYFYYLHARLVQLVNGQYQAVEDKKDRYIDNKYCPDALESYSQQSSYASLDGGGAIKNGPLWPLSASNCSTITQQGHFRPWSFAINFFAGMALLLMTTLKGRGKKVSQK